MSLITLHGFAQSTFVRTARMAAHELGIEYELKPLEFRSDSHRALHPFARMPVLTDCDTKIYETLAIVAYLDDKSGGGKLLPSSGPDRWRQLSAISVLLDYAYQPIVHGEDGPLEANSREIFAWAEENLTNSANLAGAQFSAADLFFAPMVAHRLSKPGAGSDLASYSALGRWFESATSRASFKESEA